MQVLVTPRAEKNFDSIVNHIRQKWGEKTSKEFIQKVDEIFKLLKDYPLWDKLKTTTLEGSNYHDRQGYSIKFGTTRLSSFHSLMLGETQGRNWDRTKTHNCALKMPLRLPSSAPWRLSRACASNPAKHGWRLQMHIPPPPA